MLVRVINPKRVLRSASVGAEQVPPALSTLQAGTLIWLLTLESYIILPQKNVKMSKNREICGE
jgi:hypothetical protein